MKNPAGSLTWDTDPRYLHGSDHWTRLVFQVSSLQGYRNEKSTVFHDTRFILKVSLERSRDEKSTDFPQMRLVLLV